MDIFNKNQKGESVINEGLGSFFDVAPCGVFIAETPSGNILFANSSAAKLLGTKPELAKSWEEYSQTFRLFLENGDPLPPEDFPVHKAMASKSASGTDNIVSKHADGKNVFFNANSVPLRDASGNIAHIFTILHEITGIKNDEKEKIDYVSIFAHELSNPIATILSMSSAISDPSMQFSNEQKENVTARIKKEALRASGLLKDLADVWRMINNQLTLNKTSFSLSGLCKEVLENLGYSDKAHKFELYTDSDSDNIYADRDRIQQLLNNLLDNAAKYSDQDFPISVTVRTSDKIASVAVKDGGQGIPKEEFDRIFDKYYRGQNSAVKKVKGVGLGLPICKIIAEAHNGHIRVESETNKGSTFTVSIPLQKRS